MEQPELTADYDPLPPSLEDVLGPPLISGPLLGTVVQRGGDGWRESLADAASPGAVLAMLAVLLGGGGIWLLRLRPRRRALSHINPGQTPVALPAAVVLRRKAHEVRTIQKVPEVKQAPEVKTVQGLETPPASSAQAAHARWVVGYPLLRHVDHWQPGEDETGLWHAWRRPRPVPLTVQAQRIVKTPMEAETTLEIDAHSPALAEGWPSEDTPVVEEHAATIPLSWEGLQEELDRTLGPGQCVLMIEAGVGIPYLWVSDAARIDTLLAGLETQFGGTPPPLVLLLKVQLLLQQAADPRAASASAYLTQARSTIAAGQAMGPDALEPEWAALALRLDLLALRQQGNASRLLGLRQLAARCAGLAEQPLPVLRTGLDILFYCASQQQGETALQRYTDAERLCLRMQDDAALQDEGLRLQAETLLRRAACERGGQRGVALDRAQRVADEAHARAPGGARALSVAEVALASARDSEGAEAEKALDHALWHAFIAGTEPQLYAAALQVRLAVQATYGGTGADATADDAVLRLSQELAGFPHLAATTFVDLAQVQLRHHRYAQCCTLCADAAQQGSITPALLRTWAEGSHRWAAQAADAEERAAWQRNARARQFAAQH